MAFIVLIGSAFLTSIGNQTTGQVIATINPGVNIQAPFTNNPGFENDSCPKDQDHLTCGWLINTQDCTFTAVCANIVSAQAPERSHMLSLNGTVGQAQQNNDILTNATGTIAQTPAFEFFVRWNSITSCQTKLTACLIKILFSFNSNTINANFFWTNNATIFASQFTNSSTNIFISVVPQCGSLTISTTFCHYYNPNFMSQLQSYFSNSLVSYGFGTGTGTQHGITIHYSIDYSFGCYLTGAGVCTGANWALNTDYVVVGSLSRLNQNVTSSPGLPPTILTLPLFAVGAVGLVAFQVMERRKHGDGTL